MMSTATNPFVQNENPRIAKRVNQPTEAPHRQGMALGDITNRGNAVTDAPAARGARTNRNAARQNINTFQPELVHTEDAMMIDPVDASPVTVWADIDAPDHADPQAVTTYVDEIYANCRIREQMLCVLHNYMPQQPEINERMRAILVDWMVEVHLKFKLLPETMLLAVNLIDRFLAINAVARDNLQLVGITCMFLASKYEEIYPPECNDFVYISASAYTKDQILAMEGTILNALSFNLTVPNSLHFLRRFSKAAGSDYPTHTLCKYLLELALVDMRMIKYVPSKVAAAAVYLSRVINFGAAEWNDTLQHYTTYDEATVYECANDLLQVLKDVQTSSLQAVVRKYQSRKFGEVARKPVPQSL